MQAWPEAGAGAPEADGPISWVQNADGDAVRIPTDDVDGIPAGSTVQVTVEPDGDDGDAADPLHEVIDSQVVAPAATDPVLRNPAGLTNQVTVVRVAPDGAAPDGVTTQQLVDARRRPGRRLLVRAEQRRHLRRRHRCRPQLGHPGGRLRGPDRPVERGRRRRSASSPARAGT